MLNCHFKQDDAYLLIWVPLKLFTLLALSLKGNVSIDPLSLLFRPEVDGLLTLARKLDVSHIYASVVWEHQWVSVRICHCVGRFLENIASYSRWPSHRGNSCINRERKGLVVRKFWSSFTIRDTRDIGLVVRTPYDSLSFRTEANHSRGWLFVIK